MNRPISPAAERLLVLEPGRAAKNCLSDLWAYCELFFVLAWRNVTSQCATHKALGAV